MSFRLFGINVEIQLGFWIMTFMLGWGFRGPPDLNTLIFMAVALVSILVHEYGHAVAIMRHRIEPEIALHWMGGTTSWRPVLPVSRRDRIIISLAGPFAGFLLAAPVFALEHFGGHTWAALPSLGRHVLKTVEYINLYWGALNLLPVLPWDGGHVLENALGPKRARLTAWISLVVGILVTVVALFVLREQWMAFIFGLGAMNSYQRLRSEPEPILPTQRRRPEPSLPPLPPDVADRIRRARVALGEDDLDLAHVLAEQVLSEAPDARASSAAFEVVAWVHLQRGDIVRAADACARARAGGAVDPALYGAILFAQGNLKEARRVLEAARTAGDDRKEVAGPLIQILIEQREVPRAAALAYDIVESLSEDDVRQMAKIAYDGSALDWSARLYEAAFARDGQPDDAYEAARAHARDGERARALELLRRAVEAGFSDRARAWSDSALEPLQAGGELETVLPRP